MLSRFKHALIPVALCLPIALAACQSSTNGSPGAGSADLPASETTVESLETKMPDIYEPMVWSDLTSRPLPKIFREVRIGPNNTDVVDLWIPDGKGPHPVVIMIHGGCWQKGIADRTLMNYAAEDLRAKGLAVWNIEYRGVDETGGGYPGTFLDVAKATDALPMFAKTYDLKTDKIAVIGHSAGGHLAAWLSTRPNLPKTSPLYAENPLPIHTVINSGGLADLAASAPVTFDGCLANILDVLVGAPSEARPNIFSDTSPVELFPVAAKQISVNGDQDTIAPPLLGEYYTAKAKAAGMEAQFILAIPSGHVELVAPGTEAFDIQSRLLIDLLKDAP